MESLQRFIRVIVEAESDVKLLIKANKGALYELDPAGFKKLPTEEQERLAREEGPKFSAKAINAIEKLSNQYFPTIGRRQFVEWLAGSNFLDEDVTKNDSDVFFNSIRSITDWINAVGPDAMKEIMGLSFDNALDLSYRWHDRQAAAADDKKKIKHNVDDIVFEWKDGWVIVKVPSSALGDEGEAMGHCVGGYCPQVDEGSSIIFSLRDPQGKPHVTIEATNQAPYHREDERQSEAGKLRIVQVKGKGNAIPKKRSYVEKIKEWLLSSSNFSYGTNEDFIGMLSADDVVDMLETSTEIINLAGMEQAANLDISDEKLKKYLQRVCKSVDDWYAIVRGDHNSPITQKILKIAADSDDVFSRHFAASRIRTKLGTDIARIEHLAEPFKKTDENYELARQLASDPDPTVRRVLAKELVEFEYYLKRKLDTLKTRWQKYNKDAVTDSPMFRAIKFNGIHVKELLEKLKNDDNESVAASAHSEIELKLGLHKN